MPSDHLHCYWVKELLTLVQAILGHIVLNIETSLSTLSQNILRGSPSGLYLCTCKVQLLPTHTLSQTPLGLYQTSHAMDTNLASYLKDRYLIQISAGANLKLFVTYLSPSS